MGREHIDTVRQKHLADLLFAKDDKPFSQSTVSSEISPSFQVTFPDALETLEEGHSVACLQSNIHYRLDLKSTILSAPFSHLRVFMSSQQHKEPNKPSSLLLKSKIGLSQELLSQRADLGYYGEKRTKNLAQLLQDQRISLTNQGSLHKDSNFALQWQTQEPGTQHFLFLGSSTSEQDQDLKNLVSGLINRHLHPKKPTKHHTKLPLQEIEYIMRFPDIDATGDAEDLLPGYLEYQQVLHLILHTLGQEFAHKPLKIPQRFYQPR